MSKTLTRVDIVESANNQLGLPKRECAELVEILLDKMKTTLASGEDVMISGFGKFSLKDKKARRCRFRRKLPPIPIQTCHFGIAINEGIG